MCKSVGEGVSLGEASARRTHLCEVKRRERGESRDRQDSGRKDEVLILQPIALRAEQIPVATSAFRERLWSPVVGATSPTATVTPGQHGRYGVVKASPGGQGSSFLGTHDAKSHISLARRGGDQLSHTRHTRGGSSSTSSTLHATTLTPSRSAAASSSAPKTLAFSSSWSAPARLGPRQKPPP